LVYHRDVTEVMHLTWSRQRLRTNYQEVILCSHEIPRPWVRAPVVTHRGRKLWEPAEPIRECCIARGKGLAIAAWWWEVEQRFNDLLTLGLADPDVTEIIKWQLDIIEEELEEVVPKPTRVELQRYVWYREDLGLERKLKNPPGFKQLGLKWPCTRADLDTRWRELARAHHPDRNGNAGNFHNLVKAYKAAKTAFERHI
jgi:hypothetical protein